MQLFQDKLQMMISPKKANDFKKLGKAKPKTSLKQLFLADFLKVQGTEPKLPEATNFWTHRAKFPLGTWGNTKAGDCTRAKQALAQTRMERLERKRTIVITEEEVLRVYYDMTKRLYGGGDTGAYEVDALSEWRKPDLTFRDNSRKKNPLTIDAFLAINNRSVDEIKKAIHLAGAHGIAVCFNLPAAWSSTYLWDIPEDQQPFGNYEPGSWGGHSMWALDYKPEGVVIGHTWGVADGLVTWRGMAQYCDEANLVIDSVNAWSKRKEVSKLINMAAVKSEVNAVSAQKIK